MLLTSGLLQEPFQNFQLLSLSCDVGGPFLGEKGLLLARIKVSEVRDVLLRISDFVYMRGNFLANGIDAAAKLVGGLTRVVLRKPECLPPCCAISNADPGVRDRGARLRRARVLGGRLLGRSLLCRRLRRLRFGRLQHCSGEAFSVSGSVVLGICSGGTFLGAGFAVSGSVGFGTLTSGTSPPPRVRIRVAILPTPSRNAETPIASTTWAN